jgi:hypothetical protein
LSNQTRVTDSITGNLNTNSPGGGALQGLNKRNIDPIPARLKNIKTYYFIYNISDHRPNPRIPISWTRALGGLGTWYIWAREKDDVVSKPTIVPEVYVEQYDDGIPGGWGGGNLVGRIRYREEEGDRIVREILGTQQPTIEDNDLTNWGVFLAEKKEPTKAEIEDATAKMTHMYQLVVADGDTKWANPDTKKLISSIHVRAANYLLQERDWASPPKKMVPCPGCGGAVFPHVAYHAGPSGCGSIVNMDAAKQQRMRELELDRLIGKKKEETAA